jgi:predicted PurR-regulated permease PerM
VISSIVRLLRLASLVICAIVIASFAIFAYEQTKSASKHQTEELSGGPSPAGATSGSSGNASHDSSVHREIDNAAQKLTSPFAGVVSSSSEWLTRGVKLLLALLVYGFGVGFLARTLRVRV